MKIAVLSDFHFGHASNTELEDDSFDNAEEAMNDALDSDLIIISGDVFDSRMPKTGIWAKAIKILVKPMLKENTGVRLLEINKELKDISKRTLKGIPLVVIHGNHERKARDEINAVEALEHAGILIYLHGNTAVFEKDGKKVAIHGMGNVPERYAKTALDQWNPQPVPGCFNILLIHQSIDPYVFSPLEPPSLSLSNLPKGFDLIIDGHLHTHIQDSVSGIPLVISGSTVITQLEKSEAEIEKGLFKIELDGVPWINFTALKNNRKFFYYEVELNQMLPLKEQIENVLNDVLNQEFSKKPLVKIKIRGKETDVADEELRHIVRKYSDKFSIMFVKELETPEMTKKIEFLRNLREEKLSVEEIGLQVLKKNLDELEFENIFDYEQAFSLLSEGDVEKLFNILIGEQKVLGEFQ